MHWHPACILTLGVWVSVRLTLAEPCRLARKGAADTRKEPRFGCRAVSRCGEVKEASRIQEWWNADTDHGT
jgi:hypothetical protein